MGYGSCEVDNTKPLDSIKFWTTLLIVRLSETTLLHGVTGTDFVSSVWLGLGSMYVFVITLM
jgi:hypothetical protein